MKNLRNVCKDHGLPANGSGAALRTRLAGAVTVVDGAVRIASPSPCTASRSPALSRAPADGSSSALAYAIAADSGQTAQALQRLRGRIHAFGTKRSRSSRLKLAVGLLKARGLEAFPLTKDAMELVYAFLVAAKYRSAALYVSALRVENTLRGTSWTRLRLIWTFTSGGLLAGAR